MFTMGDLVTTAASQKGYLPDVGCDIHCPMMGGPDYKLNYLSSSCRERQLNHTCEVKDCARRVNLVRPGLVQVSAEGVKQEQRTEVIPVSKKPVRKCKECGRTMAIVGRGLCGSCLRRLKKDGTLDEKHPSMRPRKAKNAVNEDHAPSQEVEPDPPTEPISNMCQETEDIVAVDTDDPVLVRLEFWPRDLAILAKLKEWANVDRRGVEDQIMFALDNLVEEKVKRGEL